MTMRIDIITLFPELCEAVMGESIVGRARKKGAIEVYCHQLREYTYDKPTTSGITLSTSTGAPTTIPMAAAWECC